MTNFVLGFTARYLGRRSRWTDAGQGLVVKDITAWGGVFDVPVWTEGWVQWRLLRR